MMPMSLADLDMHQKLSVINRNITRIQFALKSYDNFCEYVRAEIDYAVSSLQQNANKITFALSEDQLTLYLLGPIKARGNLVGLDASHETNSRGHCDISIRFGGYVWHGEAKKHSSYSYIFKGYAQLTERYSTGAANDSSGAVIIYTKNKSCRDMMRTWRDFLCKNAPRIHYNNINVSVSPCTKNPLVFYSIHTHTISGLDYKVMHYPVMLHHKPVDPDL